MFLWIATRIIGRQNPARRGSGGPPTLIAGRRVIPYVCAFVCVRMSVRMCLCVCVCAYVCAYVCRYVCAYVCMYVGMSVCQSEGVGVARSPSGKQP